MDYAAAQTAVMNFLQALGGHALNFFIALLSFAGAVFLIRWGMPIVLNALNGEIESKPKKTRWSAKKSREFIDSL